MFSGFGMPPAVGGGTGEGPIVTFKAGKLEAKPQTGRGNRLMVTADPRKGQVSLVKGADDDLLHFQWRDRTTNVVQDDLILFADEAEFKRCKTGRESDRVYILQMRGSSRRFFYWMQDKDASADEERVKRVADLCNDPSLADAADAAGAASVADGAMGGAGNGMLDMFRGAAGQGAGGGAGAGGVGSGGPTGQVNMADLQSILQNMGFNAPGTAAAASSAPVAAATSSSTTATTAPVTLQQAASAPAPTPASNASAEPPSSAVGSAAGRPSQLTTADLQRALATIATANAGVVPLTEVVQADDVAATGILDDPEVQAVLIPLLAEGQQTPEELREIVRRPQLQQALGSLTSALLSDNFNSVVSGFELDASNPASMDALARGDGVEALLQALIHAAQRAQQGSGGGGESGGVEGKDAGSS